MTAFLELIGKGISYFLQDFIEDAIKVFATVLADIMSLSIGVLQMDLVENGIQYAQGLALTLLIIKAMNEAMQTYILYQNGDPDSDPSGLLIRTGQAVAIIATSPWILTQVFEFGTKVANDVANLGTGQTGVRDWAFMGISGGFAGGAVAGLGVIGITMQICFIGIIVFLLIVAFQATIRGAEIALLAVLGPILALNITSTNRNVWSSYFKQVIIICTSQALQIFMIQGALSLMTNSSVDNSGGVLLVLGWLWVTIKTPNFVKQFAYSTGFTGAVGGTAKQAGTMYIMRSAFGK